MNFLKLLILNFCPINIFRLNMVDKYPHIFSNSLIHVFNKALEQDEKGYVARFREIFEIPESEQVLIFNYFSFEHYYKTNLKDKELSYSTLFKINKYGCVYKTDVPVYRALNLFVEGKVLEHHYLYHTIIIIIVTTFSCLLSSVQIFKSKIFQFTFTSLVIIVPHLFVMYLLNGIYVALVTVLLFSYFFVRYVWKKKWKTSSEEYQRNGFVPYVHFSRGSLIVAIILAILAVDNISFNQFMRKTYYDGFSAMDIGSGFFIAQTGASIALSRRKKNIWTMIKKNIIILAIAIIRTITVACFHYSVDEREYGIHWNFFYTLAFTRLFVDIINRYCHDYVKYSLPFVISIVYEIILVLTGAINKLPLLDRSNFIYANREGFLSVPNSISASLFVFLVTKASIHYYKNGKIFKTLLSYYFPSFLFFTIANLLYFAKLKSSRSLNNFRYLMYVMFLYTFGLGSVVSFEIVYPRYKENELIETVGSYPLVVYLVANIITGLVNLIFKPYLMPLPLFVMILFVYFYLSISIGYVFKKFRLKSITQWL